MTSPERRIPLSSQEFQSVIKYVDTERSPVVVVKQTHAVLELFRNSAVRNYAFAQEYLQRYSLSYLKKAQEGTDSVFNSRGEAYKKLDLETKGEIAESDEDMALVLL